MVVPPDSCSILIMKQEIISYSYVSVVSRQIKQRKFIGLNTKLGSLPTNLSFWIRLVLGFVLSCSRVGTMFLPNTHVDSRVGSHRSKS